MRDPQTLHMAAAAVRRQASIPGVPDGSGRGLAVVAVDSLSEPPGRATLATALLTDGMCCVAPPAAADVRRRLQQCVAHTESFFARPAADKVRFGASHGRGRQFGYMANAAGGAEMFEAMRQCDPGGPWPSAEMQRAVLSFRELLHETALACLRALALHFGLDAAYIGSLLDQGPTESPSLDAASFSTMRIWRYYPGGVGNEMHVDNSLLTVTAAGTQVGLGCMRYRDGAQVWPEAAGLETGDRLLVFAGDALSMLTGGRLPALMHWVRPPREGDRISMPYFLRPRRDALLSPARCCGDDAALGGVAAVVQRDLEANARNVRYAWEWKRRDRYYDGCVLPRAA